ncbi:MAG TPA: DNA-binding protein [Rhodospirillaceae bacterium]|nr:DNA-binding protein [Rhodospirillaceae bacterium]
MLTHEEIWRAIDRLAERNGLTPSGLARKAQLSPTAFNPSKRASAKRKRWPSTESIAAILTATACPLEEFIALITSKEKLKTKIPVLTLAQAARPHAFSAVQPVAVPNETICDHMALPAAQDPACFALEIDTAAYAPVYPEGAVVILCPSEKVRRGDRVALRTAQGDILIRRLSREGAQKIELSSLAGDAPPETLTRSEIQWIYKIQWASQ